MVSADAYEQARERMSLPNHVHANPFGLLHWKRGTNNASHPQVKLHWVDGSCVVCRVHPGPPRFVFCLEICNAYAPAIPRARSRVSSAVSDMSTSRRPAQFKRTLHHTETETERCMCITKLNDDPCVHCAPCVRMGSKIIRRPGRLSSFVWCCMHPDREQARMGGRTAHLFLSANRQHVTCIEVTRRQTGRMDGDQRTTRAGRAHASNKNAWPTWSGGRKTSECAKSRKDASGKQKQPTAQLHTSQLDRYRSIEGMRAAGVCRDKSRYLSSSVRASGWES
jgi:hypothetical protein